MAIMKLYLTIGEVSKIKKISIKSLRYYERIGILTPAKINEENGYRFYSVDQLLAVDMIKFLAAMDLPLKDWGKYFRPGSGFYLAELIADSKSLVNDQIYELQMRLNKLELAERGLRDNENYNNIEGFYKRRIPERNFLCHPLDDPRSMVEFHKKLTLLFEKAKENGLSANYPSGILMVWTPKETAYYTYLEIYEKVPTGSFSMCVPEQVYDCIRADREEIMQIHEKYPKYFSDNSDTVVIGADSLTSPVEFRAYPVELQFAGKYDAPFLSAQKS